MLYITDLDMSTRLKVYSVHWLFFFRNTKEWKIVYPTVYVIAPEQKS